MVKSSEGHWGNPVPFLLFCFGVGEKHSVGAFSDLHESQTSVNAALQTPTHAPLAGQPF
ncbi:hypothetical protein Z947_1207 [Sulfitobacter geojensis]|nr:hypothetical protein Z947_1207 [Sulfitobacter geojensis]